MSTRNTSTLRLIAAALALVSAACVSSTEIPPLTGPSEFALSFGLTASPDTIPQDGRSQSTVTLTARDASGKAVSGVAFRMDMLVGFVPADYGTLSSKNVVTGSDGKATVVYTAPPPVIAGGNPGACKPSAFSPSLPGVCVSISATPVSTNFTGGTNSEIVDIHLTPLGVIAPPADTPTAQFVVTPTPVNVGISTNFDGSLSCGGPIVNGSCSSNNVIVSWTWGFGDGDSATGKAASHTYRQPGTYTVILTVTNDGGKTASTTQSVTVGSSAAPTAQINVSPTTVAINEVVHFNGMLSKAATGRTITAYSWVFGDGAFGSGPVVDHVYTVAGSYSVTLTVTDDAGQTGTASATVNVGSGAPNASLTISKSGLQITADASGSTAATGATLVDYSFNWGDGSAVQNGAVSVRTHLYGVAGTYVVSMTVTDNLGRARSVIQSVDVP
jgi:PKD repeat protein